MTSCPADSNRTAGGSGSSRAVGLVRQSPGWPNLNGWYSWVLVWCLLQGAGCQSQDVAGNTALETLPRSASSGLGGLSGNTGVTLGNTELKGKRLGSVWTCVRIGCREGIRGSAECWFTPVHAGFMKLSSVPYFWRALVSIGSLALATEKLGNGRPTAVGRMPWSMVVRWTEVAGKSRPAKEVPQGRALTFAVVVWVYH
jgi:hypothetical protein